MTAALKPLTALVFAIALAIPLAIMLAGDSLAQTDVGDGQIRELADGALEAWDQPGQTWVSPQEFWQRYAQRKGGLTFGSASQYPPYSQVSEGDTFLVQTAEGPCLMLFFHRRWRRANDVRRWDQRFNQVAGCPHVFD